jgi:PIN domain nuclease of toxin-antitoxin system
MRVLLDTNALLWAQADSPHLPTRWRDIISDPSHEIWVSSVSLAEIAIKVSIGKLVLPLGVPVSLAEVAVHLGCGDLLFAPRHVERMRTLPLIHRDPFDRMIIAQALVEDLAVMTADRQFATYGVRLVPA